MINNKEDNRFYSKSVRAGRRTYFFDLKKTRKNDPFLTITESKKFTNKETGDVRFEKHRIFLYHEDFEKFIDALTDVIEHSAEIEDY